MNFSKYTANGPSTLVIASLVVYKARGTLGTPAIGSFNSNETKLALATRLTFLFPVFQTCYQTNQAQTDYAPLFVQKPNLFQHGLSVSDELPISDG